MAGALSTKTCSSTRVRFSQLSARSSAASIRAVPMPLPVVAHCHPDAADVTHAPACGGGLQAEASDHLALHAGHQRIQPLGRLREALSPRLGRRERHLQGARYRPRAAEDTVQRLVVPGLRAADGYLHIRPPSAYPCGVKQRPQLLPAGAPFARLVSWATWCAVPRPGWLPGSPALYW